MKKKIEKIWIIGGLVALALILVTVYFSNQSSVGNQLQGALKNVVPNSNTTVTEKSIYDKTAFRSITLLEPAAGTTVKYKDGVKFAWKTTGLLVDPSTMGNEVQMSCSNDDYPTTTVTNIAEGSGQLTTERVINPSNFNGSGYGGLDFTKDIYCKWRVSYYFQATNQFFLMSREFRKIKFEM